MGFHNGAYATAWDVKPGKGNWQDVKLTISRKNKDGQYEQDFSGFCAFMGQANAKASRLKPKDRIKLGDTDVSTFYQKEKKVTYTNFKVFDFEMADEVKPSSSSNHQTVSNPVEGENDENDVPF